MTTDRNHNLPNGAHIVNNDPLDIDDGPSACLHCGNAVDPLDLGNCPSCGHQPGLTPGNCRCRQCLPPRFDPATMTHKEAADLLNQWLLNQQQLGELQAANRVLEDAFASYERRRAQEDGPLQAVVAFNHLFSWEKGRLTARPITIIV